MSRASARRSGTNCGRLSRCSLASASCSAVQRRRHVAGELQLLARDEEHLLDLGDRDLVARRREIAIERLQRRLLRLRFGDPRLEERDLGLRVAQVGSELLSAPCPRLASTTRRRPDAAATSSRSACCVRLPSSQSQHRDEHRRRRPRPVHAIRDSASIMADTHRKRAGIDARLRGSSHKRKKRN